MIRTIENLGEDKFLINDNIVITFVDDFESVNADYDDKIVTREEVEETVNDLFTIIARHAQKVVDEHNDKIIL